MTKAIDGQAKVAPPSQTHGTPIKLMLHAAAIRKLRREGKPLPNGPLEPLSILSPEEITHTLSLVGMDDGGRA